MLHILGIGPGSVWAKFGSKEAGSRHMWPYRADFDRQTWQMPGKSLSPFLAVLAALAGNAEHQFLRTCAKARSYPAPRPDRLFGRGGRDTIGCGSGRDEAVADLEDELLDHSCERVLGPASR
jgi:hypothetical protein